MAGSISISLLAYQSPDTSANFNSVFTSLITEVNKHLGGTGYRHAVSELDSALTDDNTYGGVVSTAATDMQTRILQTWKMIAQIYGGSGSASTRYGAFTAGNDLSTIGAALNKQTTPAINTYAYRDAAQGFGVGYLSIPLFSAATVGLTITGVAAQTADYLDVTTNGGAVGGVFKIAASGAATFGSTVTAGGFVGPALTSNLVGTLAAAQVPAFTGDVTTIAGALATTVAFVGGSSAANIHAAELLANAATSANTAATIVRRDASGNFVAGSITATLSGTATNITGVLTAASMPAFTGDVTTAGGALTTTVAFVGGSSAANVHAAELLANAATNLNTVSAIMRRDTNGDYAARDATLRNGTFSGTLGVTGVSTLGAVNAGAASVTTLAASGATTLSGTLGVTGASAFAGIGATTGAFSGAVTMATTLTVTGAATFNGGITIAGVTNTGNESITGTLSVTSTATLSGNATVGGTFAVTGATTLGALAAGATGVTTLAASGTATLAGVTLTTLSTSGTATFNGAIAANNTLTVTGSATLAALSATNGTFSGTLAVTGVTTLGATTTNALTVTTAATIGTTLGVTGNTTLSGALNVTGLATFVNTTQTGTMNVAGNSTLAGVTLSGTLSGTNAAFTGTLTGVAAAFSGALSATGGTFSGAISATNLTGSGLLTMGSGANVLTTAAGLLDATKMANVLPVANGGTGLSAVTANGLLAGNAGGTAYTALTGTTGQVMQIVAGAPVFATLANTIANYSLPMAKLSDGAVLPTSPSPTMSVTVNAAKKFDGAGNPVQWSGGNLDLTSYVPGSGTSVWVMIYLNATAAVYASAGVASATPTKPQAIGGQTPLAYVLLYAGQITVQAADIYDWRTDFAAFATGGGTGSGYSAVGHLHGQGGESFVATAALDELRPTTPGAAGMTVYVQPGKYSDTSSFVQNFAGGASGTIAKPISNPYYVAVGLSQAGSITLNYGAEGGGRGGFLNATDIPIAYVLVRTGSTRTILNDDTVNALILDARRPYTFASNAAAGIVGVAGGGTGSGTFATAGLVYTAGGTTPLTSIPVTLTSVIGLGFNPTVTPAGANADLFQGGGGVVATGTTNIPGTVTGLHILASTKTGTGTIGTFNAVTIEAQTIGTTNTSLNVIGNAAVSGNLAVGGGLTFSSNLVITASTAVVAQFNSGAAAGIVEVVNHAASATGLITSWRVNGVEQANMGPGGVLTAKGVVDSGTLAVTGAATFSSTLAVAAIGPVAAQQHTLPAVASDTIALLAATQTFTNKTLTGPTINAATLSGTFAGAHTLSGVVTLSAAGAALVVTNNATIGGTLGVTGLATHVNGTFSGTLGVTGLATFVNGTFSGTLGVTGTATMGVINASGLLTLSAAGTALSVTNNATVGGILTVSGAGIAVTNAVSIGTTLGVTGAATFAGISATSVANSGNGTVGGTLGVTGNVTAPLFIGALNGNADTATNATNVTGTVAVANGGTGGTTAATARSGLGLAFVEYGGYYGTAKPPGGTVIQDAWTMQQAGTFQNTPASGRSHVAKSTVPAAASTTFNLRKNGSTIGTVVFAAAGTVGSVTWTGGTQSVIAGDEITLVTPGTADTALAGLRLTLQLDY